MAKTTKKPASIRSSDDLRPAEIDALMRFGTDTGAGVTVLTRAAARTEITRLRREIAILERLGNSQAAVKLDASGENGGWTRVD